MNAVHAIGLNTTLLVNQNAELDVISAASWNGPLKWGEDRADAAL